VRNCCCWGGNCFPGWFNVNDLKACSGEISSFRANSNSGEMYIHTSVTWELEVMGENLQIDHYVVWDA
jgi:hypothetical protein